MCDKLFDLIKKNYILIIGFLVILGCIIWLYGCVSTTHSLLTPEKRVSRSELEAELNYYIAIAKARFEDLDQQDALKKSLFDAANLIAQNGSINPGGLLTTMLGIGGIAFGINEKKKNVNAEKKSTTKTA